MEYSCGHTVQPEVGSFTLTGGQDRKISFGLFHLRIRDL